MDYTALILAFFAAIVKCIQNRDKEAVTARLLRGGVVCAGAARRVLRHTGLRGEALRQATADAMTELETMSAEEVTDLIEDAVQWAESEPIHVTTKG